MKRGRKIESKSPLSRPTGKKEDFCGYYEVLIWEQKALRFFMTMFPFSKKRAVVIFFDVLPGLCQKLFHQE